jgi:hypothetical protein
MGVSVEKCLGHEDLGGCAIATLDSACLDKGLLNRMELPARGQCFNCRYLVILDLYGSQLTASGWLAVKQDGARPTVSGSTAELDTRVGGAA